MSNSGLRILLKVYATSSLLRQICARRQDSTMRHVCRVRNNLLEGSPPPAVYSQSFIRWEGNAQTCVTYGAGALLICLIDVPAKHRFAGWLNDGLAGDATKFFFFFYSWNRQLDKLVLTKYAKDTYVTHSHHSPGAHSLNKYT